MQRPGGTILRKVNALRLRSSACYCTKAQAIELKYGYVEIIGGIRLKIIGWDRRYDEHENREARLVYREGKMILRISERIPRPKQYKPRDAIAVDINKRKIVYGDDKINKDIGTAVDRAYRWKILAENLQRKYSSPRYPAGGGEKLYIIE
jgi:transposase